MFKNNIKFFREQRKISQMELAQRAGLSKSYISALERYKRNPTLQTLHKISSALEICVGLLVTDNKYCSCLKCKEQCKKSHRI
ncbi:helix-turn-helix domain-containing protein [Clostridium brassicae]|uniref:Helix-turn-helix transcriptional regulator n=1 Tax=Clostridium brassicae TaxID=2999072 RepID=A0ABT4D6R5_9CLOT|nr:helix-turn-helix transcriptional regulator [Clostridium brassicae]MCY6957982.1 helix-turn-helix transcriptional regulator [Clostridium brassicae]